MHIHKILVKVVLIVVAIGTVGCASTEPVFIPQGTVLNTPATIKVAVDENIALSSKEPTEARLPVSRIGSYDVEDTQLVVVVQLDPIVRVARAHAQKIEFASQDGDTALEVDGFLVDTAGIADLKVDCIQGADQDQGPCEAATLRRRDGVLETILLAPVDMGGTTLMSKHQVAKAE